MDEDEAKEIYSIVGKVVRLQELEKYSVPIIQDLVVKQNPTPEEYNYLSYSSIKNDLLENIVDELLKLVDEF